ncbi:MAG: aminodeoxychorismate/anthranilate synthase component II [Nocardioidaceae bacterium]|nr:aminodeoxychorismate/anthranilate synthase component II [Nocardioidaceae bacterium]
MTGAPDVVGGGLRAGCGAARSARGGPGAPAAGGAPPHDSYTWNLVHLIAGVTGMLPTVVQHDEVTPAHVLEHEYVVLSPGPGNPETERDFSVGRDVVLAGTRPVLGVCLGLQGIVTCYGGTVDRVRPGHGVAARVRHGGTGLFAGVPDPFSATRYHSLAALEIPEVLQVTGVDEHTGLVMAIAHRDLPIFGVQFHPESVLSEHGEQLIANFLAAGR